MIPVSLLGLVLFYIKHQKKSFLNSIIIKSAIIGFLIPSLDYIIKLILSFFSNSINLNDNHSIDGSFFHSIFTFTFILLLIKIIVEYYKKENSNFMYIGMIMGYFSYIFIELSLVSKYVYIFWPIADIDLFLKFEPLLISDINENFQKFAIFFLTLEFLFFYLFGKLLNEVAIKDFLSKKDFLKINRWTNFQKNLFKISFFFTMLVIIEFYINKNLLLFIYMLFYTLSTIQYLIIVLNFNLEVKTARIN